MEVSYSSPFIRSFRSRIKSTSLEHFFWEKVEIFIKNPFDERLKTLKLSGKLKELWSFTVNYELRIVFYFTGKKAKKAVFVDIGNHDEVY